MNWFSGCSKYIVFLAVIYGMIFSIAPASSDSVLHKDILNADSSGIAKASPQMPYGGGVHSPIIRHQNVSFTVAPKAIQQERDVASIHLEEINFPTIEQNLDVDMVLVPQDRMVISSTRDDKIQSIFVRNGDSFEKGDILLEYRCAEIHAEKKAFEEEKELTQAKLRAASDLFNLNMISRSEKLELQVEDTQADARKANIDAKMERCKIRAPFDGRVVERLSHEGEYTRTERVLMEIIAEESLKAEFLLPSIWLRWVNVGSPISIYIEENDTQYQAQISRIHGRIDPASKTIQVVAELENTRDRLIPGMSGKASLDAQKIRASDIPGFLTIPNGNEKSETSTPRKGDDNQNNTEADEKSL